MSVAMEDEIKRVWHASRVIGDWIQLYNQQRPQRALDMKTPAEAFALQRDLCGIC